jgi:hypothetical protein
VLMPLYFLFDLIGRQEPPPITHPGRRTTKGPRQSTARPGPV